MLPEALHVGRGGQQFVERSACDDTSGVHEHDVVRASERGRTVRHDETRDALAAREQALPQLGFRLGIERRREVVEDEELASLRNIRAAAARCT